MLICPTGAFNFENVAGFQYVSPSESAYKLGYYRLGSELDLRPNYVQDVTALLQNPEDRQAANE